MDTEEKRSGRPSGESAGGWSDAKETEAEIHAPKPEVGLFVLCAVYFKTGYRR